MKPSTVFEAGPRLGRQCSIKFAKIVEALQNLGDAVELNVKDMENKYYLLQWQ
jgi:hypothetical protein